MATHFTYTKASDDAVAEVSGPGIAGPSLLSRSFTDAELREVMHHMDMAYEAGVNGLGTEPSKEVKRQRTNMDLMRLSAEYMIAQLSGDKDAKQLRQLAYQHWDNEGQREVQVHVLVITDPDEFLEPFQTERTT